MNTLYLHFITITKIWFCKNIITHKTLMNQVKKALHQILFCFKPKLVYNLLSTINKM